MKLYECLRLSYPDLPTVGACYTHVVKNAPKYFGDNIDEELNELVEDIKENLGSEWDDFAYMSVYEAADIVGYDLVGYVRYAKKQRDYELEAAQLLGVL